MYYSYELWALKKEIKVMGYNRFCKEIKWCGVETYRASLCLDGKYIKIPEFVGIEINSRYKVGQG